MVTPLGSTTDAVPHSLRDAFDTNDISRFRTILTELPDSEKAAAWTALGCNAASEDKPEILALLLPHRPRGEFRQDIPPDGLLACVADSQSPRVCDAVIDAGIDITIPGSFEPDLLEYCIDGSDPTLVKHIFSPSVQVRTTARLAHARHSDHHPAIVAARSAEMAQTLIDHGAELEGTGVLHYAARDGNLSLVECFLNASADVNDQKGFADTPLHWATSAGRMDAARLLLARGADRTAKDAIGRTPLDRVISAVSKVDPRQDEDWWEWEEILS